MRPSIAACLIALAPPVAAQAPASGATAQFNCSYWEEPGQPRVYIDGFVIFFDPDSSAITPYAGRILDQAVTGMRDIPHCAIRIAGHADRSGPADHNERLAERRAKSVVDYFRSRGVRLQLLAESHGERRPLVETPDGVPEPQNRRVEMVIVPRRARQ